MQGFGSVLREAQAVTWVKAVQKVKVDIIKYLVSAITPRGLIRVARKAWPSDAALPAAG